MAFRDTAQGLLGGLHRFSNGVSGLLFPGMEATGVDPRVAQAAKAQAMMQMGAGLLGGQNFGQAYGLGQQAGYEPIEQARRQELVTAAAQDRQAMADERTRRQQQEEAAARKEAELLAQIQPLAQAGDYEGIQRILAGQGRFQDAKAAQSLGAGPEGAKVGAYNPGDYTPQSFAQFVQGGMKDPGVLRRQYAPPQPATMIIGGVPSIVNKGSGSVTPLSSYDAEVSARAGMAGAEQDAKTRATESVQWEAGAPQREAKARSAQASAENVRGTVQSALGKVNEFNAGFSGARLAKIEGTAAYDLNQQLTTIKANLGFDRLQQMREQSPTGGALGQVAVQELQALQAAVASLDIGQSPKQLSENLRAIDKHYSNWQSAVEKARNQGNPVKPGAGKPRITSDAEYNALPSGAEFIDPEGNPRRKP